MLLTPGELAKHPELKGWSMWHINTLRSRHRLMPPPIVRPHLEPSKKEPGKVVSRGRLIFYPIEIIGYLKKIDRLKKEGLSYREIAARPDIKKDLAKYKLLNETEIRVDNRLMDQGFFANFHSARANLARFHSWQPGSPVVKFLESVADDRDSCAKEYYAVNKRMRKEIMEEGAISKDLKEKKEALGYKLDYLHSIMEATTKEGVRLLKDKRITMEQWFAPIRHMDRV